MTVVRMVFLHFICKWHQHVRLIRCVCPPVTAQWEDNAAVNGGEWNNVGVKVLPKKQAPKAEKWTPLPQTAAQPNPEMSVWGQEIEGMTGNEYCNLPMFGISAAGHYLYWHKPRWSPAEYMLMCQRKAYVVSLLYGEKGQA